MLIDDDELVHFYLRIVSYYRLSAYWHPFRKIEQNSGISEIARQFNLDRKTVLKPLSAASHVAGHPSSPAGL